MWIFGVILMGRCSAYLVQRVCCVTERLHKIYLAVMLLLMWMDEDTPNQHLDEERVEEECGGECKLHDCISQEHCGTQ